MKTPSRAPIASSRGDQARAGRGLGRKAAASRRERTRHATWCPRLLYSVAGTIHDPFRRTIRVMRVPEPQLMQNNYDNSQTKAGEKNSHDELPIVFASA